MEPKEKLEWYKRLFSIDDTCQLRNIKIPNTTQFAGHADSREKPSPLETRVGDKFCHVTNEASPSVTAKEKNPTTLNRNVGLASDTRLLRPQNRL